ncbi:MAG: tRNA uridine-5-carboxymethylaminomethyl(34) synthesis GTPase MnmE [Gammaproteobacteria bacterium]
MSQIDNDTICAIATPPGRSGVGIIRISGDGVAAVASAIIGKLPEPRFAHYSNFRDADGSIIDQGLALFFPGPNSFTGEDVLELQGHGGAQVLTALLNRVQSLGPRLARAGEFSERAFLNNKIDLLQAEAIADLIDASSEQARRSAMRTLQGEFSRQIHSLVAAITAIRVNVEAAIDFSDEDIDVMSDTGVGTAIQDSLAALQTIFERAEQGALLKEGINVVIAGQPNAGKSSLLNTLSGQDSAIVTEIAGTTRDLLRQEINLNGLPIHVTDTAGLRDSDDPVEQEGVRRARAAMTQADQILLVVDSNQTENWAEQLSVLALDELSDENAKSVLRRTTLIANKIDLRPGVEPHMQSTDYQGVTLSVIHLSAQQQLGIELLISRLQDLVGFTANEEGVFVARKRHLDALASAHNYLNTAAGGVSNHAPLELIAEDLRLTQRELGQITGEVSSDDLLGEIFSNFCVGK